MTATQTQPARATPAKPKKEARVEILLDIDGAIYAVARHPGAWAWELAKRLGGSDPEAASYCVSCDPETKAWEL